MKVERKSCKTCRFQDRASFDKPCLICSTACDFNMYERICSESDERSCETCEHENVALSKMPCSSCKEFSAFEPGSDEQ